MTDNNEATAWNGVLAGGGTAAPATPCAKQGLFSQGEATAIAVGATIAGFFTGVAANRTPKG